MQKKSLLNRFEKYLATPKESAPMDDAIIRFPNAKGTEQIGQKKQKKNHPPSAIRHQTMINGSVRKDATAMNRRLAR